MALFGSDRPARRGTPADVLVLGLGNPGKEFDGSRHNLGVEVLGELARRHGGSLKKSKERALTGEVTIGGRRVALAFPQTYMNLSGESASLLVRRYGIERPEQIIVVHDELDLPPGGLPTPIRTRRKASDFRCCFSDRSPLWPASPPPSLTFSFPGGRSSSSWTTRICSGRSMP